MYEQACRRWFRGSDRSRSRGDDRRAHVLVYSNNAVRRNRVRRVLNGRYRVSAAATRRAALIRAGRECPEVLVAVLGRDRIAAEAFVRAFRHRPAGCTLPMIVLSPEARAGFRTSVLRAGAQEYCVLPVDPEELAEHVDTQVAVARARRGAQRVRSHFERVVESINDVLIMLDREWRYVFVNERMKQVSGLGEIELLGRSIWQVFPALCGTCFESAARDAMTRKHSRYIELDYPPWQRSFDIRLYPGEEGLTVFASDITEVRQARLDLARSEMRFQRIAESVAEIFWIFDRLAYRYDYVSPAVNHVFGVTEAEVLADPDMPGRLMVDSESWEPYAAPRFRGPVRRTLRYRIRRPDGALRWIESHSYPFDEGDDRVRWICGISADVTEQVEAEQVQQRARDELESRVAERTRELAAANRQLEEYAARARDTSRRIHQAQEEERREIARYLHDEVGQSLAALRLQLAGAHEQGRTLDAAGMVDQIDEIIGTVRDLSRELRPSVLDDLGLAEAIAWQARQQASAHGVRADTEVAAAATAGDDAVDTACYRIAQEAIRNALTHSGCTVLRVRLDPVPEALVLSVRDDGPGFDVDAALTAAADGASLGLLGMRERAALVGGTAEVRSGVGEGTIVEARFPRRPGERGQQREAAWKA